MSFKNRSLVALGLLLVTGSSLGIDASFWLEGPESGTSDDSPSDAICPSGYHVTECYCHDDSICDGSGLDPTNVRKCTSYKKAGVGGKVKAIARCKLATGYEVTVQSSTISSSDELTCPDGSVMDFCTKNDPWSQQRVSFLSYTVTDGGLGCTWKKQSGTNNNDMPVSAVCIKRTC
ncbi:uncharacterized protein [Watersipora subatra]|uniref:uncharacterized protein n=1 Tax=Watersipora subatra TaxID=2589382 RepID=UPI00355C9B28